MPTISALTVRSNRSRYAILAALVAAAVPTVARAQATVQSYMYQYIDAPNPFQSTSPSGCFNQVIGAGAVSADVSCSLPAGASGSGSVSAIGASSFDPVTGTFKSKSSIVADHFTLSQFIPPLDGDGNRLYTGEPTPDAVGVVSQIGLSDMFLLSPTAGVTPAKISFFLDMNGTFRADPQINGAGGFVANFVNFCTGAVGICGTSAATTEAFFGGAGESVQSNGLFGFGTNSTSPVGSDPASVDFDGTYSATGINGRLTLSNLTIAGDTPYDFNFFFGTQAVIFHPTNIFALSLQGCDPRFDPTCVPPDIFTDPIEVDGETSADFSHTLTFAGYQVLDASGNDITASVKLTFGSGLGAPVATPEPATLTMLGGGFAVLGMWARRRRSRGRSHN